MVFFLGKCFQNPIMTLMKAVTRNGNIRKYNIFLQAHIIFHNCPIQSVHECSTSKKVSTVVGEMCPTSWMTKR